MTALEAAASITSDSVTAPTALRITLTITSSWGSLEISSWIASSEPATSDLITRLISARSEPKMFSRLIRLERRRASASVLSRLPRSAAICLARRSFSTTLKCSPASGTLTKPRISTGSPGSAWLMRLPRKSLIARTLP